MVVDNTEIFFRVCRKTTIDKEQDIAGIYFGKKYKDTLNPVINTLLKVIFVRRRNVPRTTSIGFVSVDGRASCRERV